MDRRLLLFLALASVFMAGNTMAATDLSHADTSVQGLLDLVLQQSHQWSAKLYDYAIRLFWLLASIQFIWTFMPLVMKQADFGEIVGELLRFVLVIGFFLAVMKYSVEWSTAIVDSFRDAAASASGLGRALEPGDMLAVALDFGRTMVEGISVFSPAKGLLIAVCATLVLACFAFIAAFMFVTLVEAYVIINASVLFLGFGGSQWTQEFAIAPMRFTVAIGAKLFVLTLILGLVVQSAKQWLAAYTNDEASLMTMVGLALVCCYLTKTIPDLIGGMISGTSIGHGQDGGGRGGCCRCSWRCRYWRRCWGRCSGCRWDWRRLSGFCDQFQFCRWCARSGGDSRRCGRWPRREHGQPSAAQGASSAGARVGGSAAQQQPSSGVQQAGKAAQDKDDKDDKDLARGTKRGSCWLWQRSFPSGQR